MLFIRVGIAIAAAILMSEMILLQVFAGDITQQIQDDHLVTTQTTINQIQANYQPRIDRLQKQIDAAQATVNADQQSVTAATKSMKCQEFGCPGRESRRERAKVSTRPRRPCRSPGEARHRAGQAQVGRRRQRPGDQPAQYSGKAGHQRRPARHHQRG